MIRICCGAALALMPAIAAAAEPIGEWLVADGSARIRIENCGDKLWGVVSWEKNPGNIDTRNPSPAQRGRPVLWMPVLLGMQAVRPNLWEGKVYNAENGQIYQAKIRLGGEDVLQIEGCVLGGLLCGGESWSRFKPSANPGAQQANPGAREICSSLSGTTGSTHEHRLK